MNFYHFHQEQYYIVFNGGEYLDVRYEEKRWFALYTVGLFFVEVEYNQEDNKIVNKRAFVQEEILDKYSSPML